MLKNHENKANKQKPPAHFHSILAQNNMKTTFASPYLCPMNSNIKQFLKFRTKEKMKKHAVMLGALLAVAATGAQAQTGSQAIQGTGKAEVKVNVTFTPVVEIKLTPGKDDKLSFSFANVKNYEDGIERNVPDQLSVFAVGSGYEVKASVSTNADLLKLFQLGVGTLAKAEDAATNMTVYTSTENTGNGWKKLHAQYKLKPLQGNLAAFTELLKKVKDGKVQTQTIDITYTIAAK